MPPVTTPVSTIDSVETVVAMAAAADENDSPAITNVPSASGASVSIADAIATATDNLAATGSSQPSKRPTSPPIKEYVSNAAAAFTYDRTPKGVDEATEDKPDEAIAVGSVEWYMSLYDDEKPSAPDSPAEEHSSDMDTNNQDW
eukprot:CAMPEP_0201602506 /NCGR_PEP_ID=MMETSP0492-20130828/3215_1 /ASSEMBLY_ACC=CAM_ASM_000837 /TAXON_ID=420259 /ORGANISM="Thalassiosira gravida, Strain GMp14c1" /LENGTH=143 /DNA_ID=CAMNT_0048066041 /DNA_START=53 /DNA_END=481 /DNA_ORIENTATION=+